MAQFKWTEEDQRELDILHASDDLSTTTQYAIDNLVMKKRLANAYVSGYNSGLFFGYVLATATAAVFIALYVYLVSLS